MEIDCLKQAKCSHSFPPSVCFCVSLSVCLSVPLLLSLLRYPLSVSGLCLYVPVSFSDSVCVCVSMQQKDGAETQAKSIGSLRQFLTMSHKHLSSKISYNNSFPFYNDSLPFPFPIRESCVSVSVHMHE